MKTFKANLISLYPMLEYAKSAMAPYFSAEEELSKIELALEEALVNIIYYAYPYEEGDVSLRCFIDNSSNYFVIEITDQGIPFNPLDYEKIHQPNEGIGGHGIHYIKNIMDKFDYKREGSINRLVLYKYLIIN